MKILFTILFLFLVSIYSIGCDTSNSSTNSSDCPFLNQSLGCDSICAENPLQNDACGICDGDGSTCDGLWDVFYDVSVPIGGFQFNIDGAIVTGASGGAAAEAGFTISTGVRTVLAFSFTGATIPAGNGLLVQIEIDGDANSACLADLVMSDASGNALDVEFINCNTIKSSE